MISKVELIVDRESDTSRVVLSGVTMTVQGAQMFLEHLESIPVGQDSGILGLDHLLVNLRDVVSDG